MFCRPEASRFYMATRFVLQTLGPNMLSSFPSVASSDLSLSFTASRHTGRQNYRASRGALEEFVAGVPSTLPGEVERPE